VGALERLLDHADGRVEAEGLVDERDVVVDGLGHADHGDLPPAAGHLLVDRVGALEGAVTADTEEDVDFHFLQAVDHHADVLGAARTPEHRPPLVADGADGVARDVHGLEAVGRVEPAVAILETDDVPDPVVVVELEKERADDTVDPRREAAAGHHGRARRRRVEVNHLARPRLLEIAPGVELIPFLDEDVTQDPAAVADEAGAALAGLGGEVLG
jgi:hypothetical protein